MVGRNGQIGSIKSWGGVSSGNGQWTRLAKEDGLEPLQGHGIGISATLFHAGFKLAIIDRPENICVSHRCPNVSVCHTLKGGNTHSHRVSFSYAKVRNNTSYILVHWTWTNDKSWGKTSREYKYLHSCKNLKLRNLRLWWWSWAANTDHRKWDELMNWHTE